MGTGDETRSLGHDASAFDLARTCTGEGARAGGGHPSHFLSRLSKIPRAKLTLWLPVSTCVDQQTFPALFGLYQNGFLPNGIRIIGYARSKMDPEVSSASSRCHGSIKRRVRGRRRSTARGSRKLDGRSGVNPRPARIRLKNRFETDEVGTMSWVDRVRAGGGGGGEV